MSIMKEIINRFRKEQNNNSAADNVSRSNSDENITNEYRQIELYALDDEGDSHMYGLFISADLPSGDVSFSDCTLFDRETYEEFNAYACLKKDEFRQFMKQCISKNGEFTGTGDDCGVSVECENGTITKIEVSGRGSFAAARYVSISASELLRDYERALSGK